MLSSFPDASDHLNVNISISTPKVQVLLDTVIFSPLHILGYFGVMNVGERGSWADFSRKVEVDFVPTLAAELAVWPAIQAANFKFIRVDYQLLAVNLLTIFGEPCMPCWGRMMRRSANPRDILVWSSAPGRWVLSKLCCVESDSGQGAPGVSLLQLPCHGTSTLQTVHSCPGAEPPRTGCPFSSRG